MPLAGDQGAARSGARPRAASAARAACERRERLASGASGFRRGRGLASDRRIVAEAGSTAAAQGNWLTLGWVDDLEPTPSATRVADAAATSGTFYFRQVFGIGIHRLYTFTIDRREQRPRDGVGDLDRRRATTSSPPWRWRPERRPRGRIVARGQPAALSTARIRGWPSISSSSTTSTSSRPTIRASRRRPSGEKPQ